MQWLQLHRHWPRLLGSLLVGVVVYLLLPVELPIALRLVIAWDIGIVCFIALILAMMLRATPEALRYRAQLEDEQAWVILMLMVGAALASLIAIAVVLHDAKDLGGFAEGWHVSMAGVTIFFSWVMAHTMFALHYAHIYYDDAPGTPVGSDGIGDVAGATEIAGGLAFPSEPEPDYGDFLYFSFIIGMTCQVSDVSVTSRRMRRLALVHGIVAFLFNTVILALSINLIAGLL